MATEKELAAIRAEAAKTRDNCDYCKARDRREQEKAERKAEREQRGTN